MTFRVPEDHQDKIGRMLAGSPRLPVVSVPSPAHAAPMAAALQAKGYRNVEITLRTPAALDAIAEIARSFQGMEVGAGTVLDPAQAEGALRAGALYAVSPGFSAAVHDACAALDLPYLPGAATPTEVQALRERGYRFLKFFPAEAAGGVPLLRALAPVFPDVSFCATGGITTDRAQDYLSLPNVRAVGMSSIVPARAFETGDWSLVA